MEQEVDQINKNILSIDSPNPDNIEQRITSMLEDVLKGDSSDEDLKNKVIINKKQPPNNFKPLICLNDMPVPEDIYVIEDPKDFTLFSKNPITATSKKNIRKNNNLDFRINDNINFLPKNISKNNLSLNNNNGTMLKPSQNLKTNNLNITNNTNTLNFNGMGNFNLSPSLEKRTDKNNVRSTFNNKNVTMRYSNESNLLSFNEMSSKNSLNIPVILYQKIYNFYILDEIL